MEHNETKSQRWENETNEHKDSVPAFLASYLQGADVQGVHYDPITELHFSGTNRDLLDKIVLGAAKPQEVSCFYEGGRIKQIHVVFSAEGKGEDIDVYLLSSALEGYLGEKL